MLPVIQNSTLLCFIKFFTEVYIICQELPQVIKLPIGLFFISLSEISLVTLAISSDSLSNFHREMTNSRAA